MDVIKSILFFIVAGLCEIGGGYLIWLWLRDGGSIWIAILGGVLLISYGLVATFQPANFGRVYAAYGGVFIVMAIIWGWQVDKIIPDRFDIIGSIIAVTGAMIIMFWPRN
jgi:small multidrug resistance family-3 protein